MAVQAELVVRHHGCVTEQFHGATTLAQISADRRRDRRGDLFLLHAATSEELDAALQACVDYAKSPPDVIDRQPTSMVFRGINAPGGVVDTIRASTCSILWPIVYRDGLEYYRLLAPSRRELRALLARLEPLGELALRSVGDVGVDALESTINLGDLTRRITRTQLEVLLLAVRRGYYATPRKATTAQLARLQGVSPSTLAEHLRKAERTLLLRFGAWVEQADALARGATKRRGRPRRAP